MTDIKIQLLHLQFQLLELNIAKLLLQLMSILQQEKQMLLSQDLNYLLSLQLIVQKSQHILEILNLK